VPLRWGASPPGIVLTSGGRGPLRAAPFELPPAPIRLCAAALLLMMAAFVLVKTARDALFFTGGGIEALPHAYLGIAIFSLPLALATGAFTRLTGPRRARVLLPVLASALFLVLAGRPGDPGSTRLTIFFMLVPLLFGLLFSTAWLLAGELLEGQLYDGQVAAYQWIGAASILGGAIGGALARALAGRLSPLALLGAGCACLVASAGVMAWTQLRYRTASRPAERAEATAVLAGPAAAPAEAEFTAGASRSAPAVSLAGFLRRVLGVAREPYVRRLAMVAMVGALTGVLVEFLFYLLAASSARSMGGNARFFANAYLVMNASAFLLQVVVFRPLQRWIGITGTLLTLPLVLFGGASVLLAGLVMTVGSGLRIAEGGVKQSLHRLELGAGLPAGETPRSRTREARGRRHRRPHGRRVDGRPPRTLDPLRPARPDARRRRCEGHRPLRGRRDAGLAASGGVDATRDDPLRGRQSRGPVPPRLPAARRVSDDPDPRRGSAAEPRSSG